MVRVARFFLVPMYQNGLKIPNDHKIYKIAKNIPKSHKIFQNIHKIFQIAIKYSK
jgi:hypothetical protein